jgi:lipopolysaccharide export system protein LptC
VTRERNIRSAVAEILSPHPGVGEGGVRSMWDARARGTALEALRYSQFVTVMKRALPIAAGALVVAVIVYSLVPRPAERVSLVYQSMTRIDNDLAMMKPRLTGADSKGNPFTITADEAIQDRHDMHRAKLQNIEADISLDNQHWLNVTSTRGHFDMDTGALALSDGVSVYTDSGYELHTSRSDVDMKKGSIRGPVEATGQGPLGSFRADKFAYDRKTNLLNLYGNVRMTMYVQHSKGKK